MSASLRATAAPMSRRRWLIAVALLGVATLLLALAMGSAAPPWWALQWLAASRFADAWLGPVPALIALVGVAVGMFVPVGILTSWLMTRLPVAQLLRDALALLAGVLVVLLAWWLTDRLAWLLWLAPALPGLLLGVALGPALRPFAPGRLLRRAALTVGGLSAVALACGAALLTPHYPFSAPPPPRVDRGELIARVLALDPRPLAPRQRAAVQLTADDVTALVLAAARRVDPAARVRTVPLRERGALGIAVAIDTGIPGRGIVALDAELAVRVGHQERSGKVCGLRIGSVALAGALCRELLLGWSRALPDGLVGAARGRSVAELDLLRVDADGLTFVYHRPELDDAARSFIQELLGPPPEVVAAVDAQLLGLAQHAPALLRSRQQFQEALRIAFRLAEVRARVGKPVLENQGAMLALAMVWGDRQIALIAGLPRDTRAVALAERIGPLTLYGRKDWAQHFIVSAALAQIATAQGSDAVGTWKEQLDARSGSGFSFTDLLMDRAGTRFGERLAASDERAVELQRWLAAGPPVAQLVPSPAGLPEGLDGATFAARYGAVGSPAYRAEERRIEARLAALALYRDAPLAVMPVAR